MISTYLLVGASSSIAKKTAESAKLKGHKIIGISTKEQDSSGLFDPFYTVNDYQLSSLPDLNENSLNGLVYFPGTINLKPFNRLVEDDFLTDYRINALGAANSVQKYLPLLKQGSVSSVVFISSVAATLGLPFHASISMAKGAIESLTRSLASEFAPSIRVNCVAPSLTNTPLAEKLVNSPEKYEASQKRNPMNKVGEAKDISEVILFLLSDSSSWITGQVLAVDGGMSNLKNK